MKKKKRISTKDPENKTQMSLKDHNKKQQFHQSIVVKNMNFVKDSR